jgi:alpha-tubulin suppressor-like RCC1 family protein
VVGVSCGHNFTLAWLHDGKVLSWGSGHHGVLGHGDTSDVTAPTVIDALKDETIVEAAAGHSHSAFVTKDGKVYTCGKGKDGALGLGEKNQKDVLAPQLVTFPQEARVVQASCSVGEHHGHTLAVTEEGQVYAWGDGYKGKLGLGSQDSHYTPACIPTSFFNHERVITVCAGGIHSMAATAEGHVYTWGCGSDGRLGHPEGKGHRYLFRSDMPKQVEGCQSKTNFVSISCTYYHSAAIIEL